MGLFAILLSLIVVIPIVTVGSFFIAEAEEWLHLRSTVLSNYITNSLIIGFCVFVLTVILGTMTAWIISIYKFRFSKYLEWLLILPLAIPSYALCYVYSDIFGL